MSVRLFACLFLRQWDPPHFLTKNISFPHFHFKLKNQLFNTKSLTLGAHTSPLKFGAVTNIHAKRMRLLIKKRISAL